MPIDLAEAEAQARLIIGGSGARPDEVLALESVLHGGRKFGLARRLLARYVNHPDVVGDAALRLVIGQKLALCTYKDPDLQADQKLDDAWRILQSVADLETTKNQETLGLAGAILKRTWELTAQVQHLETSFSFYFRGFKEGVESDFGYTAINAAFVADCLADIASAADQPAFVDNLLTAQQRRDTASSIRREIVARLPALGEAPGTRWLLGEWWFLVTLGEAWFGLGDATRARHWLMQAAALPNVPDWQQESSARQIAALLVMKNNAARHGATPPDGSLAGVLREFLGSSASAFDSAVRGKIGLALSGGGFRASFYHIGVLAKLAELDLLRHVECLSCVSGGSIIGAHYYLEVRKLLGEKPDDEIRREDYLTIVENIQRQFFEGVRSNIRTRIAAEWLTNLKMIFVPGYSRTMRAGELYESELYSRVTDGEGRRPRWLNALQIVPKNALPDFSPKDHNWRRAAKAPILVLNATTLNTGHNWQFTSTWMGEPPAGIDSEVDANCRLRRMYYPQAPSPHEQIRLGYAVAASACVPGIFEPLTLANLYERMPPTERRMVRPLVRLVDGGVYDNQGVAALLEQDCSVLIVSDASGQMQDLDFPGNGLLAVPLRANSILQARVRVAQFEQLSSRLRSGLLRGLMFVHLKKDLETTPVDWIDTQEPVAPTVPDPLLPYGVQRHVQRLLAAVRTDLDSFSQVEAHALMASGYLMTEHSLKDPLLGFEVDQKPRDPRWTFLEIDPYLKDRRRDSPLVQQLKVANSLFFKVWLLMRQLQIVAGVFAIVVLVVIAYAAYIDRDRSVFTLSVRQLASGAGLAALVLIVLGLAGKIFNYRKTASEVVMGIGMATFGFPLARLHLHVFDKLFLWQGSMKRLRQQDARSTAGSSSGATPPVGHGRSSG